MKKLIYSLLVSIAAITVSCTVESIDGNIAEAPNTGEKITFTASINLNVDTKAALSGLNINWQAGDYIGIATDNSATIVAYPVTPDGLDPTQCTITVDAVPGATAYYALFKGSLGDGGAGVNDRAADDFSDVSFSTETKTFSGLTVGNQQVASSSLSSYLWYTSGFPLAMAGKSSGSNLVMNPCLALFKLQIHSDSVPEDCFYKEVAYESSYSNNHNFAYSAVRGFNLYQKGSSTIYSSGDYNVQIADDGSLTTTSALNENKKEYRQISQSGKLTANTDYIMCLIPGGDVTSFRIDFLGYSDNTPTITWDAPYSMTKTGSMTVSPGTCYSLGKLNPLGRKQAANEAYWEAQDAAAAAYVPAISVDGDVADWAGISPSYEKSTNSRIREFRFKSDAFYVYCYFALRKSRVDKTRNLYVGFDTDNDSGQGKNPGGNLTGGYEAYFKAIPFTNESGASTLVPVVGEDASSVVWATSTKDAHVYSMAYDDGSAISDANNIIVEMRVSREELKLPGAGETIKVQCSYDGYTTDTVSVTLE